MTAEESLYAYLTGYAGLTALVSTRIWPLTLPDEPALPALTYHRISRTPVRQLATPSVLATESRFQFSCWGVSYADAKKVANQVEAALVDFTGVMGGTGGITVLDAHPVGEVDLFDGRVKLHHCSVDIMILYQGG